jgi:Protein of unknown function (DUF3485)
MVWVMVESASPDRGRRRLTVANLVAFALLVGSGLVHGRLTDRWGTSTALAQAVARLDRVPRSVGDWEGRDVDMDRRQIERAQIQGYLSRKYRNVRDGREITVLLVCGRPGPISVHTPDVCYAGAGYEAGAPPVPGDLAAGDHRAAFLKARFTKADALVPETLDIFWAWNARGVWEAPANPRIGFAPYEALFKVYVIAGRSGAEAATPVEPAVDDDFAKLMLTALNRALFDGDGSSAKVASPPGRSPPI